MAANGDATMTTAGGEVLYTSAKPAVNADAAAVRPLTQQPLLCTTAPNALLPRFMCARSSPLRPCTRHTASCQTMPSLATPRSHSQTCLLLEPRRLPVRSRRYHTHSLSRSAASLSCPPLQATLLTAMYCGPAPLFRWCVTLFPSSLLDSLSTPTLPFPAKSTCAMTRTMLCVSRPSRWVLVLSHSP